MAKLTLNEFIAWKRGDLEEYAKALTRLNVTRSKLRKAYAEQSDAEDSMSVFSPDERNDPRYIKHADRYEKATARIEELKERQKAEIDAVEEFTKPKEA